MMRSIRRVITTSTIEPANAQTRPRATPITNETLITATPMNSETRAPNISRDSMSWPSPSVPSGNRQVPPGFQTGGARTASRNCSIGECGAMKSAPSATSMTTPTTVRPNTAPRFSRNVAQNPASGVGWARMRTLSSAGRASATSAAMAYPRVDRAVEQIDDQVHRDDGGRNQQHAALERGIVPPADRLDQPFADARPGKYRLGEHRAGHQSGNGEPDHGHDRQQR